MSDEESLFTSEAVSPGHPDKLADRISDAILDAALRENPRARVAVETLVTRRRCVIAGEITGASPDAEAIARRVFADAGHVDAGFGDAATAVEVLLHAQSKEIGQAVDGDEVQGEGAGDQGLMFGFACDETEQRMPAAFLYAHALLRSLGRQRLESDGALRPDAKSQVTLAFRGGRPVRAHTIVISQQHARGVDVAPFCHTAIAEVFPPGFVDDSTRLLLNPSGSFVLGGPAADTGLTGRKIIVDTYGGAAPHGGGAFSGKDPTKVDRSAAYAARWLARNVVAAGLARRCTLQLAYAIGVAEPLALRVDTAGTGRLPDRRIEAALRELAPLTPRWIRDRLALDRPIYERTSLHGHFGHVPEADGGFSWEAEQLADALREACDGR